MVQPIVSHTTYIAIGIIAVLMIITSLYTYTGRLGEIDATAKLNYIADDIQNKLIQFNSLESAEFGAKVKIGASQDNKILVKLSNNLITVSGYDTEITKDADMQMSGEAYLPAYLVYENGKVTMQ
ncbi:MAG: hypothetical protein PHU12_02495 [Candidatus Aenigmarchaeota archaeon]|nr:hypothetical protein [Candidatus Aenigmarchaeota archaeon]